MKIDHVKINLFNGIFKETIPFKAGLNIISGENGTGKTRFLINVLGIAQNNNRTKSANAICEIEFTNYVANQVMAFSPKRNAVRQNASSVYQSIRKNNSDTTRMTQELKSTGFNDVAFSNYKSFTELFIANIEEIVKAGDKTYAQAVGIVGEEYTQILTKIFPTYTLKAEWQHKQPMLKLIKHGNIEIDLHEISSGESAILSLLFGIYSTKDQTQLYLIDEAETHLNWQLENNLFNFLKWFCETYDKQIIVTTHSRAIFQAEFLDLCIFFKWHEGKIIFDNKVDELLSQKIAGDSINIISGISLAERTFYVEDKIQQKLIEKIAEIKGLSVDVRFQNGRSNVEKLFKILKKEKIKNTYFVIDNDNRESEKEFLEDASWIQLSKYCTENYLLDIDILTKISEKPNVAALIDQSIKEEKSPSFLVFKKLLDAGSSIDTALLSTLDGSKIVKHLAPKLGFKNGYDLMDKFIEKLADENKLEEVFSEIMSKLQ